MSKRMEELLADPQVKETIARAWKVAIEPVLAEQQRIIVGKSDGDKDHYVLKGATQGYKALENFAREGNLSIEKERTNKSK